MMSIMMMDDTSAHTNTTRAHGDTTRPSKSAHEKRNRMRIMRNAPQIFRKYLGRFVIPPEGGR